MTRFSGPEESPGFLLWRVTLAWQRAMRTALTPHDLTHVQFVLLASLWWLENNLENHTAPPSQQRLAQHAGTDPMMTSQVIRKLAERGLLDRTTDPGDSRAKLLTLTEEGRALLTKALKDVEEADTAYFATLGEDQKQFVRSLVKLVD